MSFIELLDTKFDEYSRHYLGSYQLRFVRTDMNYVVNAADDLINYLALNDLLRKLNNAWNPSFTTKSVDNLCFKTFENVIEIDCNVIQRRDRLQIAQFISKILKRAPLMHDKHIIVLRNFDSISVKYQHIYKSILDKNFAHACFVIGVSDQNKVLSSISCMCCNIRLPRLNEANLTHILTQICSQKNIQLVDIKSIVLSCDLDLYTSILELEKLHTQGDVHSTFNNVFEVALRNLIRFLKQCKSLEKVITQIRCTMHKILHYSLSDAWICRIILDEALKIPKLKKQHMQCVSIVAKANHQLLYTGKKIFVYEHALVEIYLLF